MVARIHARAAQIAADAAVWLLVLACSVPRLALGQRVAPAGVRTAAIVAVEPYSQPPGRSCVAALQVTGVVVGLAAGAVVATHNKRWLAASPFRLPVVWVGFAAAVLGGHATGTFVGHRLC